MTTSCFDLTSYEGGFKACGCFHGCVELVIDVWLVNLCGKPVRPVLKHGPRSLTCARVVRCDGNLYESGMKVKDDRFSCCLWCELISCVLKDEPCIGRSLCQLRGGAWLCSASVLSAGLRLRGRRDSSMSVPVGTRKMVNYAWIGWSQRKLWWKLVAVLTCKSIVKFGYRGERLIEPSSSWFPPKFPSG